MKDGTYEIYQIQHLHKAFGVEQWVGSNLEHFGTPPGFSTGSRCYLETGIVGTYSRELALDALPWLRDLHPGQQFRVVLVRITKTTVVIE